MEAGDNMSASVTIPIAGFKDVYDVPTVEKALQELSPGANEALRAVYEKMLRLGGQRFTVKPSALPAMQAMFDERLLPDGCSRELPRNGRTPSPAKCSTPSSTATMPIR